MPISSSPDAQEAATAVGAGGTSASSRPHSPSMASTMARASACPPRISGQRGDSGSERRHHSSSTIGKAVIASAQRQPLSLIGTTNHPTS
nr:hypothetical protein [Sphingomonas oleivorans]